MIQVLISTMFLKNAVDLLRKMNIQTDAIIIDQCDRNEFEKIVYNGNNIEIYHTIERGLSKSRNYAIKHSKADIIIFADDDFYYSNGYYNIIEEKYNFYKDADIIVFGAIRNDDFVYRKFKNGRLAPKYRYNINSIRITAKRESLVKMNLYFDERFGTGSEFSSGEDNIFISDCFKNKLNIYTDDYIMCVGIKDDRESTWWHGYNHLYKYLTYF